MLLILGSEEYIHELNKIHWNEDKTSTWKNEWWVEDDI